MHDFIQHVDTMLCVPSRVAYQYRHIYFVWNLYGKKAR